MNNCKGPSVDDDRDCNRVLSEDEIPCLRSSRKECQTEIDAINARIGELVQQRKVLEDRLGRYDALLAPIKRIPFDVLSTVFELATDVGSDDEHGEWKLPTVLPSRICKAWRKMAIEAPKLWCTLRIVPPEHPHASGRYNGCQESLGKAERLWGGYVERLLDVLPLWIERSRECSLFVTLKLSTMGSGWSVENAPIAALPLYKGLVHLACSVSRRWREVDLDVATSYSDVVEELLELRPEDVPRLERISLQTGDGHGANEREAEFHPDGILAATSLRSATIIYFDRRWNELSLPWSRLKQLRLGVAGSCLSAGLQPSSRIEKALGLRGVVTLLSVCPDLESFEGAVCTVDDEDPRDWVAPIIPAAAAANLSWDRTMVVRLPKLKEARFHGEEPWEVVAALDLPSLQSLEVTSSLVGHSVRASRAVSSQRFMHAIGRFGSQLTKVRFNFSLLLEGDGLVTACLRSLRNLQDLQIDPGRIKVQVAGGAARPNINETASRLLLELLTPGGVEGGVGEQVLCPRLERFACALRTKGFTEDQLVRFITQRNSERDAQALSELREVDVYFSSRQTMDVRRELESRSVSLARLRLALGYPPSF